MAAVTVNTQESSVIGSKRQVTAQVDIANTGDTFDTGLKVVDAFSVVGGSAAVTSATKSGGTLTFATGGAVTDAQVIATGL
jgi:hypothetical protein